MSGLYAGTPPLLLESRLKTAKEMARSSLKPELDECEFNAAVDKAHSTMECLKPSPAIVNNLGKSE